MDRKLSDWNDCSRAADEGPVMYYSFSTTTTTFFNATKSDHMTIHKHDLKKQGNN